MGACKNKCILFALFCTFAANSKGSEATYFRYCGKVKPTVDGLHSRLCGYEPFFSDNEAEMFRKIIKCDYVFDSPWWDDVSDNAKDLISKLLVLDATKRLTAVEALRHPWVIGHAARGSHMEDAQSKLKQFNARRKLKAATDVLMAFSFKSFGSLHSRTDSRDGRVSKQSSADQQNDSSAAAAATESASSTCQTTVAESSSTAND